jgi:hypothetical protein
MIPYGIDLNKIPVEDPNSKALVLVNDARPLAVIPPPKPHSCGQSYFARPVLPSPPQPLLLKGAPPKGPIVKLPEGTKVLSPKPNETLLGVKKNRSGEIVCTENVPMSKEFTLILAKSSSSCRRKLPSALLQPLKLHLSTTKL